MPGTLIFPLAQSTITYLTEAADYPFAKLMSVECSEEYIKIDVIIEPKLTQVRLVRILQEEPIAIIFPPGDTSSPFIFSNRPDFPHGLVHTTWLEGNKKPAFCVWEENWHDVAAGLNGQALIERIRDWLSRMAAGSLHHTEQAPEPLIPATSNTIILPPTLSARELFIDAVCEYGSSLSVFLDDKPTETANATFQFQIFDITVESQVHGSLSNRPNTLHDLDTTLSAMGYPFKVNFTNWLKSEDQISRASEKNALIIISIPMLKEVGGEVEGTEVWAFTSADSIAKIGNDYGITWTDASSEPNTTSLLFGRMAGETPASLLEQWRVVHRLNTLAARKYSNQKQTSDYRLIAIGAGAIGSNVVSTTAKAGIGRWTIIDDDILLPHNTVRQFQDNRGIGHSKANYLCYQINNLLGEIIHTSLHNNVLNRNSSYATVLTAVQESDCVLDFSASPAVVGWLADQRIPRARSYFFNPDGTDLVVLCEDSERAIPLDAIEAQYFYAVATKDNIKDHLRSARIDKIRYANACQDTTRPIATWQTQMLSAIAAGHLLKTISLKDAQCRIFRLTPESGAVEVDDISLSKIDLLCNNDWKLSISRSAIESINELRKQALPNETGGVLLGTIDMTRKVMHVIGALPAPDDSDQSPTHFIRGAKGLMPIIKSISNRSVGKIRYVGEWHSHPNFVQARPSASDEGVYSFLNNNVGPTGYPYMMLICGKDEIWLRAGWAHYDIIEGIISNE